MAKAVSCPWCKKAHYMRSVAPPGQHAPGEALQSVTCPCGGVAGLFGTGLGGFSRYQIEREFCEALLAENSSRCDLEWREIPSAEGMLHVLWGRRKARS